MAKTVCRPERKGKSGPKKVTVAAHSRTPPKKIQKGCP
jgi:hypothetical protein